MRSSRKNTLLHSVTTAALLVDGTAFQAAHANLEFNVGVFSDCLDDG